MKLLEIINSGDFINPLSDPNTIIAQAKEVGHHGNSSYSLSSVGAGQNVYNKISSARVEQMEGSDYRKASRYVITV